MIQNVLRTMVGIEQYGIVSLLLFFGCFFGMLIWVLLLKKPFLNEMSRLPLDSDTQDFPNPPRSHE